MLYRDAWHARHGGPGEAHSRWRWFPWAVAAAMGVVIAVNVGMVYAAMHTFPGAAGSDGFDLSNHYDLVLQRVQQQAALGWSVRADTDAERRPVLRLADRAGTPLTGALLQAKAERPVGPAHQTVLTFHEAAPGQYVANASLDESGQWELLLSARAAGHRFLATRRIVAR